MEVYPFKKNSNGFGFNVSVDRQNLEKTIYNTLVSFYRGQDFEVRAKKVEGPYEVFGKKNTLNGVEDFLYCSINLKKTASNQVPFQTKQRSGIAQAVDYGSNIGLGRIDSYMVFVNTNNAFTVKTEVPKLMNLFKNI